MRSPNHATAEIPRRWHGVMAVLLAFLWLWSSTLAAAWCVNTDSHRVAPATGQRALHAEDLPDHRTLRCQDGLTSPLPTLSRLAPMDDENGAAPDQYARAWSDSDLPQETMVARFSVIQSAADFTQPPLYLLYRKLLLPFPV